MNHDIQTLKKKVSEKKIEYSTLKASRYSSLTVSHSRSYSTIYVYTTNCIRSIRKPIKC